MTEPDSKQAPEDAKGGVTRLFTLDALRGLIIVLMALDHANLLVAQKHRASEMWGGAFPVYYDTLAFLTRFVTHFCAPGFFFLMGAGMVLLARARREQGWSRWQVIRHFLMRGGVLIALKLLVVNRAWELSPAGWGIRIYIFLYAGLGHLVAPRGTTIPIMYVFWLLGLLILFPLCLWYGRLKHPQPAGSLLRLL